MRAKTIGAIAIGVALLSLCARKDNREGEVRVITAPPPTVAESIPSHESTKASDPLAGLGVPYKVLARTEKPELVFYDLAVAEDISREQVDELFAAFAKVPKVSTVLLYPNAARRDEGGGWWIAMMSVTDGKITATYQLPHPDATKPTSVEDDAFRRYMEAYVAASETIMDSDAASKSAAAKVSKDLGKSTKWVLNNYSRVHYYRLGFSPEEAKKIEKGL